MRRPPRTLAVRFERLFQVVELGFVRPGDHILGAAGERGPGILARHLFPRLDRLAVQLLAPRVGVGRVLVDRFGALIVHLAEVVHDLFAPRIERILG